MLQKIMSDAEENKKNYYLRERLSLKIILWAQAGELNAIVKKFLEFVLEKYNCLHGNRDNMS